MTSDYNPDSPDNEMLTAMGAVTLFCSTYGIHLTNLERECLADIMNSFAKEGYKQGSIRRLEDRDEEL